MCVCVCVRVCACVCVRACLRACTCLRARACMRARLYRAQKAQFKAAAIITEKIEQDDRGMTFSQGGLRLPHTSACRGITNWARGGRKDLIRQDVSSPVLFSGTQPPSSAWTSRQPWHCCEILSHAHTPSPCRPTSLPS